MQIVPIFSGGGTRFSAHLGILQALQELDITFTTMVGISGGSIVAAFYSAGVPMDAMKNLAFNIDFRQFTDHSLLRLLRQGGLSSGKKFEQWLDDQLNGKRFCDTDVDLNILATDVNGGGPVIFNRTLTPDMKLSKAVRCSMSIPLLFSFQPYEKHLLVDGAILSEDALFQDWQQDGTPSLCFRLRSDAKQKSEKLSGNFLLPQYLRLLIKTFMTALSREYVHAEYWHNTLVVNTGQVSAVDFAMTDEDKLGLFNQGYETAKKYLPIKLAHISDIQV
jgi:NTE family protein